MGWFDEQIRQRKLSDQEIFEDSLFRMASAVLGKQRAGGASGEQRPVDHAENRILRRALLPRQIGVADQQLSV